MKTHFSEWCPVPSPSCPICGTREDKEYILVEILGTYDRNRAEAKSIHVECILESVVWSDYEQGLTSRP